MVTSKMIIKGLKKPNDYYDRCYKCNRLDTDGWGDKQCSDCELETFQMFIDLGVYFDKSGDMHKL